MRALTVYEIGAGLEIRVEVDAADPLVVIEHNGHQLEFSGSHKSLDESLHQLAQALHLAVAEIQEEMK